MAEDGIEIPNIQSPPVLFWDAVIIWRAFVALSPSRQSGMGLGYIPYSEITGYLNEHKISPLEEREWMRSHIQFVDSVYVDEQNKKTKKQEKKKNKK